MFDLSLISLPAYTTYESRDDGNGNYTSITVFHPEVKATPVPPAMNHSVPRVMREIPAPVIVPRALAPMIVYDGSPVTPAASASPTAQRVAPKDDVSE